MGQNLAEEAEGLQPGNERHSKANDGVIGRARDTCGTLHRGAESGWISRFEDDTTRSAFGLGWAIDDVRLEP